MDWECRKVYMHLVWKTKANANIHGETLFAQCVSLVCRTYLHLFKWTHGCILRCGLNYVCTIHADWAESTIGIFICQNFDFKSTTDSVQNGCLLNRLMTLIPPVACSYVCCLSFIGCLPQQCFIGRLPQQYCMSYNLKSTLWYYRLLYSHMLSHTKISPGNCKSTAANNHCEGSRTCKGEHVHDSTFVVYAMHYLSKCVA